TAPPLRLRAGRWQYRCKGRYMSRLPIPNAPEAEREAIANLAQAATRLAAERYELVEAVCRRFQTSFGSLINITLPEKLQNGPDPPSAEVGRELKKAFNKSRNPWEDPGLVDLWEPYLKQRYEEHTRLSRHIAQAEAEINQRVYNLFNLSRTEIRLLEAS